jgi:peroxiredoxin
MAEKLVGGDAFPQLTLNIEDGSSVTLPDDIATPFAVVLFYRGHW